MPRSTERETKVSRSKSAVKERGQSSNASHNSQPNGHDPSMRNTLRSVDRRKETEGIQKSQAVIKADKKDEQESGAAPDLKTRIDNRLAELNRRRQQATLEKQLHEEGSEEIPVISTIDSRQEMPDLDLSDQAAGDVGDDSSSNHHGRKEPLPRSRIPHSSAPNNRLSHGVIETSSDIEHDIGQSVAEQGVQCAG
ncbi:hypothetical protein BDZ45DRAFT_470625 [Acephala macrosclerotiorum]|nr:hypothetical protein BDZ45DRAFT_470625 [Acephala macrosclerotiorum]